MAIAFQAVLIAIPLANELWSSAGVVASAAVLGLTDVDALTYSMARLAATPDSVSLGAKAIAVGILSNTLLKLGMALSVGGSGAPPLGASSPPSAWSRLGGGVATLHRRPAHGAKPKLK